MGGKCSFYLQLPIKSRFLNNCINYNPNDALYELGKVSSGSEHIENITGEITISAVEE